MGSVMVQGFVQVPTDAKQTQEPDREGAQQSHTAQGAGHWVGGGVGCGGQVGEKIASILPESSSGLMRGQNLRPEGIKIGHLNIGVLISLSG